MTDVIKRIEPGDEPLQQLEDEESVFSLSDIIAVFILNWQWFFLSLFICICLAFLYLRYKTPMYKVTEKMLIKDEQNTRNRSNQMLANMTDLGFITNSTGIDNEVEILESKILAKEVVKDLKLYVEYRIEGRVKDHFIYKTQPLNIDLDPTHLNEMDENHAPIRLDIRKSGSTYYVTGYTWNLETMEKVPFETEFSSLPATITTRAGVITITRNSDNPWKDESRLLKVSILPISLVAEQYVKNTTVEPTSKMTSIALITVEDQNPKRDIDYVQQLAVCYNRQANADKNEIAHLTEEFINGRLEKINSELGTTEGALESYKKTRGVTELKLDATQTIAQVTNYSTKLSEANSQIQLLDYLREYVDNPANKYQLIPSNVGLSDNSSSQLIIKYNEAVLDRNRLLKSASENAPQVLTLTSALDELSSSIRTALLQARRAADIQRQGIQSQYSQYQSRVSNTPEQERILTQIGRQQEVKSGLYLMLLQKREENSISLAATADKGKVIDEPAYKGRTSPQKMIVLPLALVTGLVIPFAVICILSLLRYRIEGRDDLMRFTTIPIIADVAVASESAISKVGKIVVHENKNTQMDEIFRSLRTNLQFTMEKDNKVISFCSTTSGEGKTFLAANTAMSFALLNKKVILLGLDIRKPALERLFQIPETKNGITNLLVNEHNTWESVSAEIIPSGVNKNLDMLFAGPIPPNPTELLARESLKDVFRLLRQHYDFIVCDTAPVGLVSDTFQLADVVDATIFVVRADYTPKANIAMINSIKEEAKLPNISIVLNGVDMSKKKNGYYYGYGRYGRYRRYGRYGYGRYGYGRYGYGNYGNYGNYANSHYSSKDDDSIKKK